MYPRAVTTAPEDLVPLPQAFAGMRRFALDGALLCFDRHTGLTAHCDGPETAHLRIRVPRVVQFSITNACNLACTFCSRDIDARSSWTADDAFGILRELDRAGMLEVAFGGGEPLIFKGFVELVVRLHRQTQLAISLTTNGTRLDDRAVEVLAPVVGQIRLSVYDDIDHRPIIASLVRNRARFGVNWLVTPARLEDVSTFVLSLVAEGCRDILLLSYNGHDRTMHLNGPQAAELSRRVRLLSRALEGRAVIKLDVCWGERMEAVPRLFGSRECPAGREFVVITSDKRLSPCSFHHLSFPVQSADDVLGVWQDEAKQLALPARDPGCARIADFGLAETIKRLPMIAE